MFGKHLVLTFRNLRKNLVYAILVITGLAVGITTFLSSLQWSAWHLTFDRGFPDSENLYRLTFEERNDGFYRHTARILHGSMLNRFVFSETIPGVERTGRLAPYRNAVFRVGEDTYYERYAFACDSSFLKLFDVKVIQGDNRDLLNAPRQAVLSRSTAERFFGGEDPVGKSFELMHQFDAQPVSYSVTAVAEDFPRNSHLQVALLTSFENPLEYEGTGWAYLELNPSADPRRVEEEIKFFLEANFEEEDTERIHPRLQPLREIHLKSHKAREIKPGVRYRTVLVLLMAGIGVFLLAWFNFTLLSFSQNQLNIKRLIVQWQMGAGRRIFFAQFVTDHLVVGLIALLAGVAITMILSPAIEQLGGISPRSHPPRFLLSLAILLLLIISGALVTSLFSTRRLYRYLQYRHRSTGQGPPPDTTGRNYFIRSVIVLEFMITFVLVSNLFMVSRQTRYAMDNQLGSTRKEAIHMYALHRSIVDEFELFKQRMLESPHVEMVTASMEEPTGQTMDANTFEIDGTDEGDKQLFLFPVDEDFIRFYGLEILHGSDMPETYDPRDSSEFFILNETAARTLTDDPSSLVGRSLTLNFSYPGFIWPGPITGIVEDFHLSGLDYVISPMVIFPKYTWLFCFSVLPREDPEPVIRHLEGVWEELFPEFPLEFHTSSSMIESLYENERIQIRVLWIFSILSVMIAGMGLFALSGFFMQRRMKPAAIRKIHGAPVSGIIRPELLYYLWLALLSSAIAVPVSFLLIERWLRNFKYRADLPIWLFPACAVILVLFSWLAVIYHTVRLARINPVDFVQEA